MALKQIDTSREKSGVIICFFTLRWYVDFNCLKSFLSQHSEKSKSCRKLTTKTLWNYMRLLPLNRKETTREIHSLYLITLHMIFHGFLQKKFNLLCHKLKLSWNKFYQELNIFINVISCIEILKVYFLLFINNCKVPIFYTARLGISKLEILASQSKWQRDI